MDIDHYRAWGEPRFVLDVQPGSPEGFSLAACEGMHFVVHGVDRCPVPDAA